jgi:hypothetical protein
MTGWIIQALNLTRFPWFKDELINPNRLKAVYKGRIPEEPVREFLD